MTGSAYSFDHATAPVCIVTPHFPGPASCGGIGTAAYWQALAFVQAGIPVTVLYTGPVYIETTKYWEEKFSKEEGFTFVRVADWMVKNKPELLSGRYIPQFEQQVCARWVLEFLYKNDFRVVYLQDYQGHGLYALQAKKAGLGFAQTQFVVTLHGSTEWGFEYLELFTTNPEVLATQYQEKESTLLADYLIAPSAYIKGWVSRRWGIDARKILVLPNCFEDAAKGATIQSHGPFEHLVFFGRLETRKGLEIFVQAYKDSPLLRQKIKKITFLGQSGCASGTTGRQWIETIGMKDDLSKVEILERFSTFEAWSWLRSQKNILMVVPSLMDNLPLAVVEPFLRRIPFVTTDVGGIPEIVGENPEVLMPATTEGVRARLEKIIATGSLKIRYNTGFQPSKTRAQTISFFNKISAKAARKAPVLKKGRAPMLSVIMPHFNATQVLGLALASLKNQLDAPKYEVIVVDQGSASSADKKNLQKLKNDYKNDSRFKFVSQKLNLGAPSACNYGVTYARGDFVLFLEPQCEVFPGFISHYSSALKASGADVLTSFFESVPPSCSTSVLTSKQVLEHHMPLGGALEAGLFSNIYGSACMAIRRTVFKKAGGFSVDSPYYKGFPQGDWTWELLAKLALLGARLSVLPKVLFRYRGHVNEALELPQNRFKSRSMIFARYSASRANPSVDWKRILDLFESKSATPVGAPAEAPELYHYLAGLPDDKLLTAIGRKSGSANDQTIAHLRDKLQPVLREWALTHPRVFIYGAGAHTRVLLGAVPEVASYVCGIIDRSANGGKFLGWPCVAPADFTAKACDVVLYSSKESELLMYKNISPQPVTHQLLYNKLPSKSPVK